MIRINNNVEINEEEIFSTLMKQRITQSRFRLPYTEKQVYALLHSACRAEVANRMREFKETEGFNRHLQEIAHWLTSQSSTFGLFLCGGAGNGKTTILNAIGNLLKFLRSDEAMQDRRDYPVRGFMMISAKELVVLAKAYNNQTRENLDDAAKFRRLKSIEILAIDDLGTEPKESINFGDYVTAAMDVLSYRYQEQLCTFVTSNLTPKEIGKHYDERIADRFREMMQTISFGNEPSFRKL